nr:type II toxin-antitoxin system VapC family toxin [Agrobacterium sp.]
MISREARRVALSATLRTMSSSVSFSLWEITLKLRIGKLDADIEEILAILPHQGFDRLDITDAHLVALAALPFHYRDLFDHLLMAQAVAEEACFVSLDQNVPLNDIPFMTCSDPVTL